MDSRITVAEHRQPLAMMQAAPAALSGGRLPLSTGASCLSWLLLFLLLTRSASDSVFALVRVGAFTPGVVENLLVILCGAYGWSRLPYRWRRFTAGAFGPFALWQLIACFYGPTPGEALRVWSAQITYPAMFLLTAACMVDGLPLRIVIGTLIASLAVPLAVALTQTALHWGGRSAGTFDHPNILALYLVYLLPVILWQAHRAWRRGATTRAMLLLMTMVVMTAVELVTQTRSAWVAYAAVIVLFGLIVDRRLLLVLPVALALALALPAVRDRLNASQDFSGVTVEEVQRGEVILDSYSWRKLLWNVALADAADAPMIGKGVNSFRTNVPHFFAVLEAADPHSIFVQLRYEQGFVGIALFAWQTIALLILSVRTLRLSRQAGFICTALIVTTLLVGYSDNLYFYLAANWYAWAIWAAVAIAALEGQRPGIRQPVRRRPAASRRLVAA